MLKRYWYDDAFSAIKRNAGKTLTACYALEAFEMFQKVEDGKAEQDKIDLDLQEAKEQSYKSLKR